MTNVARTIDNDDDIHMPSVGEVETSVVHKAGQAMQVRQSTAMTPTEMLSRAVETGASIETLEKLMALHERWEAGQARKAFDAAMAEAKREFEPIVTNRRVAFEGRNGKSDTNYKFEDLAQIERKVGPILTKHGLSYRFRVESEPEQPVRVACVVSHRDGHSEQTSLAAGRDTSGNKNSIQAIGSTITYLQRYTLKSALGLAVAHDDDGKKAGETVDDGPISEDQLLKLSDLVEESGVDRRIFCEKWKIEALPELPAAKFDAAYGSLRRWFEAQQKQAGRS